MTEKTKLKVLEYDLKSISDTVLKDVDFPKGHNKEDYELDSKFVIIEGKESFIVSVRREGVHAILKYGKMVACDIRKKERKINGGTTFSMFPLGQIKLSLDIIKTATKTEIDLNEAVRHFGSRLDDNYALLLQSCKEIGVDITKYNYERE